MPYLSGHQDFNKKYWIKSGVSLKLKENELNNHHRCKPGNRF